MNLWWSKVQNIVFGHDKSNIPLVEWVGKLVILLKLIEYKYNKIHIKTLYTIIEMTYFFIIYSTNIYKI